MTWVSVEEITHNLLAFLLRVQAGETLVLVQSGKPFAEINPFAEVLQGLRPFGLCAGEFIAPDDFDEPLPEDIIQGFEGV